MSTWAFLAALAVAIVGTYAVRALGVQVGRRRAADRAADRATAPSRAAVWFDRATVVLIMGLVVTSTFFDGQALGSPSRMIAVGAGIGAALLKAPMIAAVLLAMGVAALLRLAGMA